MISHQLLHCKQVVVPKRCWNHKVGNERFEFVPVLLNKMLWLKAPCSQDLVRNFKVAGCHHHVFGVYQTKQGWFSCKVYLYLQEMLLEIAWMSDWNFTTFDVLAIFRDRLTGFGISIGLLRSYADRLASV
ncbi:hypothetical protein [Pseudoalteromonas sp.]|uniref:hypothetical protein n=1 Tax=Pseudoalteromonas sp. TaxID=53249 RepID=UPI002636611F|nr:hypothetical protein [Pseudoalteromonas sp.]MCP4584468.1 hypothetical protein [Pseudoalteromonas sp.]